LFGNDIGVSFLIFLVLPVLVGEVVGFTLGRMWRLLLLDGGPLEVDDYLQSLYPFVQGVVV